MKKIVVAALVAALVVAGLVAVTSRFIGGEIDPSLLGDVAVPPSLAELVARSDLIVVGTVAGIHGPHTEIILTSVPTPEGSNAIPYPTVASDYVLVEIDIERVYREDEGPRPLVFARSGNPSDPRNDHTIVWPFPEPGERFMFFVESSDAGEYTLTYGGCGQIYIDDIGPRCAYWDQFVPHFMEGMSSAEFVEAVEYEMAKPGSSEAATARHGAPANSACPDTSIGEGFVLAEALWQARMEFFEDARITRKALLTSKEYQDEYGGALKTDSPCYWRVELSGSKIEPQMPFLGTHPPDIEWTEMVVVIDAISGGVEHTEGTGALVVTLTPTTRPAKLGADANPACPADSLSEDEVRERAMTWARFTGFENAEVTEAKLLTRQQFYDEHCRAPAHVAQCYWHIVMSGRRLEHLRHQHPPPGVPSPEPVLITRHEFVIDAVTGYRASESYGGDPDPNFTPVPATEGPCPTREYLAVPTPWPLPPTPWDASATP